MCHVNSPYYDLAMLCTYLCDQDKQVHHSNGALFCTRITGSRTLFRAGRGRWLCHNAAGTTEARG